MSQISSPADNAKCQKILRSRVTLVEIQDIVCDHYGLRREDLIGADRKRVFSWPRQMAMAICCEFTKLSQPEIGRRFGGRDHSTVIHGCKAVETRRANIPEHQVDYEKITSALAGITRAEFFRQKTIHGQFASVRNRGGKPCMQPI
ncbi:hypothetical protein DL239_20245 [Sedimentitalea sp. CY04]|uniref:Chromosomal replication initiator DnaA C-terminal domain-containing protein n=1 Tax=Parasedimentitalea denitrificans TaxID=2211118 RepID=A0ABX0WDC1_9RHOB|nr:helix-turn-helix domain-containing protein [Sedimentitalea sp. CY04]NIZ63302.1 hypothetical protein [Sedimentitalea sp. CY04]